MAEKYIYVNLDRTVRYRPEGARDARNYGPGRTQLPLQAAINLGFVNEDEEGNLSYAEGAQPAEEEGERSVTPPEAPQLSDPGPAQPSGTPLRQAFGAQVARVLQRAGVSSAEELRGKPREELLAIDGVGDTFAEEIEAYFKETDE